MYIDLTARPLSLPTNLDYVSLRADSYIGDTKLIPEEFHRFSTRPVGKEPQVAQTSTDYIVLVSQWFFFGLSAVKFNLAPHVVNSEQQVMAYFREIMSSFAPSHGDKTAYLAYLLSQTCTSVDWTPA